MPKPSTLGLFACLLVVLGLVVYFWPSDPSRDESVDPAGPRSASSNSSTASAAADLARESAAGSTTRVDVAGGRRQRALSGTVVGPDDSPIPAATVTLYEVLTPWPRQDLRRIQAVYSDDAGRFAFQPWEDLDLLVEVVADGFALEQLRIAPSIDRLTVRLSYGFDVAGFVEDSFRRKSPDCEVVIEPGTWGMSRGRVSRTDKNGQFVFHNVPAGLVRLSARSDFSIPATAPMVPVGGGARVRLGFRYPGRPIEGSVVDARTGRPVDGAEILVYPASWNGELHVPVRAITDDGGKFAVMGLGQSNLNFQVRHPEFSTASQGVSIRPGFGRELRFELVGRSRVHGRILGDDVGGTLLLMSSAAGEKGRAIVADDGRFEFEGSWSASRVELEFFEGVFAFERSSSRFLEETIDEDGVTEFLFEVRSPSVLRGSVVDQAGQPVVGARVSTSRSMRRSPIEIVTATDEDGSWELRGLPEGSTSLSITHDVLALTDFVAAVPSAGEVQQVEDVVLVSAGRLEGRVTRAGRPLPGAVVFAGQPKHNRATVSGLDGTFSIPGLEPGDYRVKARYSTLPFGIVDGTVSVASAKTTRVDDIEIQAGRHIGGRVQDLNGRPIAGALIFVPGSMGASIYTDQNGKFELEIEADSTQLQVYAPDFSISTTESIPERSSRDENDMLIDLAVLSRGAFEARVLGLPDRKPVTQGVLRIRSRHPETPDAPGRNVSARVVEMPSGRLSVDWIPVGRSELILHCQGFTPFSIEVEIDRRTRPEVREILLEPGASVHGRVVDEDGAPIVGGDVYLGREIDMFEAGFRVQCKTDSDGRFEVLGVGADSTTLVVRAADYAVVETELAIPRDLMRTPRDPREVIMRRASTIRVRVQTPDGKPGEGVVVLFKQDRFVGQRFVLDEDEVAFTTFGSGDYTVWMFGDEDSKQVVSIGERPETHDIVLISAQ